MSNHETRAAGHKAEVRQDADGIKVAGYAAVFNEWTDIGGHFQERVAPGAFDGVLGDDTRFLINHRDLPLARVSSGTLKLKVDERGLYMETTLDPKDPDVQRIVPKMERGDLREMSFAFTVEKDEWERENRTDKRTIQKVGQLIDVAIVTNPAYGGTEIGLRSRDAAGLGADQKNSHTKQVMRMRLALEA